MELALWFVSRAAGLVVLPLLTLSLVLGVVGAGRVTGERWPRFALAALHRNISLMTVLFLAVHVASSIIDPYAGIGWLDAFVPFVSVYHPFWLGVGAIASDLFIAVILTSILRARIGLRMWRAVHWAGYLCWPVGLVHGIEIGGKDTWLSWVMSINVTCVLVVVLAVVWRLRLSSHPDTEVRRAAADTVGR
jgi:predicted ferric reductase